MDQKKNRRKAWLIFSIYILATLVLLFFGYRVQKPAVKQQEFPFTITYCYDGETKTISDIFVVEYAPDAKYIGEDAMGWYGYIKDHDRMEPDYYRVAELEHQLFAINTNLEPGYLMGDPKYADSECVPCLTYHSFDGIEETTVTDPEELKELGFYLVSWEYPQPIENQFSNSSLSMSSEATMYTAVLAVAALICCVILIRKDPEVTYGPLDKSSVVLNFLVALVAFPFILLVSALSEIFADVTFLQQLLYLTPALTAISVALSVTLRRMGHQKVSFWIQFVGPALFVPLLLITDL